MTAETKRLLEAAADASGRTQRQEAERRLDQSFRDDPVLVEIADLKRHLARSGMPESASRPKNWVLATLISMIEDNIESASIPDCGGQLGFCNDLDCQRYGCMRALLRDVKKELEDAK